MRRGTYFELDENMTGKSAELIKLRSRHVLSVLSVTKMPETVSADLTFGRVTWLNLKDQLKLERSSKNIRKKDI